MNEHPDPLDNDRPDAGAPAGPDTSDAEPARKRRKSHILRPPGFVVFLVVLLLLGIGWWLWADRLVERGVEATGASIVGARVDLDEADVRPTDGSVRLNGLRVTNPNAPMSNLFEADEILVDLLLEPLLSKKVVVQDLVVTGVRFNTPRETSGALENPDPEAGRIFREVDAWANGIDLPPLSLDGLSTVVRTDAIATDSLRTVRHARALVGRADSLRGGWEARLESLDPRPRIDSLRAVVQRLEEFRPTPLNATRIPGLVRDGRNALNRLTDLQEDIASLDDDVRAGIDSLRSGVGQFQELRAQDLAYARGLLDLPSLDAPEISPALFGGTALTWLKPVLYWAQTAERFLPPGLDPRNRPGPNRARAQGTTVEFPGRAIYPSFLVERGELGVEIAGDGPAAGRYSADLRNLTSQPTLVGRPIELLVGRAEGAQGPEGLSLSATLDHTTDVIRDSVSLTLDGIGLPSLDLDAFDARLDLGLGDASFDVRRVGEEIDARMRWSSSDISWLRAGATSDGTEGGAPRTLAQSLSGTSADDLRTGSAEWARDFLWRAVSGLRQVDLTMGLSGSLDDPSLSVRSNIGSAVAESLRRELGQEIEAAEARLREEVDSRVQSLVQDARARVSAAETQIADRIGARRAEVDELRDRLEERIENLVPGGRY